MYRKLQLYFKLVTYFLANLEGYIPKCSLGQANTDTADRYFMVPVLLRRVALRRFKVPVLLRGSQQQPLSERKKTHSTLPRESDFSGKEQLTQQTPDRNGTKRTDAICWVCSCPVSRKRSTESCCDSDRYFMVPVHLSRYFMVPVHLRKVV